MSVQFYVDVQKMYTKLALKCDLRPLSICEEFGLLEFCIVTNLIQGMGKHASLNVYLLGMTSVQLCCLQNQTRDVLIILSNIHVCRAI